MSPSPTSPPLDHEGEAPLAQLYRAEQGRLQRFLIRRGLSAASAADLVQDAFLRLLAAPRADLRQPRRYLFRTAANLLIDDHRRRSRAASLFDADIPAEEIADPAPLPDRTLAAEQERAALMLGLSQLPPRTREVLVMHKFQNMPYAEIAQRLGISRNTVMVHMVKALGGLRQRLREAPAGNDPPARP